MRRIIIHYQPIKLNDELSKINDYWYPQVIGEMNDDQIQLLKLMEILYGMSILIQISYLLCLKEMFIDFRDGQVKVSKGEMFIVPRGVEHKPSLKRNPISCW